MAYPPESAARSRRPGVVAAAAGLLVVMAVSGAVYSVFSLASLFGIADRYRDAGGASTALINVVVLYTAVAAAVSGLVAVLLLLLAAGVWRGRSGARSGSWVVCGLGFIGGCLSLAVLLLQRAVPVRADPAAVDALLAAYPTGWVGLNRALSIAQVLGYLVVAVLLALPSAHPYFRKRPAQSPASELPLP
ncbi:MAG TPA: hypothetical protein VF174_01900 [Micromonosporaceae bacterium]